MFSEQYKRQKVQRDREDQHVTVMQTILRCGRGKSIMTKAKGNLFLQNIS